jgi:hypothetical protein
MALNIDGVAEHDQYARRAYRRSRLPETTLRESYPGTDRVGQRKALVSWSGCEFHQGAVCAIPSLCGRAFDLVIDGARYSAAIKVGIQSELRRLVRGLSEDRKIPRCADVFIVSHICVSLNLLMLDSLPT